MNSSSLYFPLTGLINAITSVILGIFVLSKNKSDIKHVTFALFCLSMAVWSGFYFAWLTTNVEEKALLYCHLFMAGAIFIPSIYLHHILALLRLDSKKRKIILASYAAALIFSVLNLTPYFILDVHQRLSFKYWPTAGPIFSVFLSVWSFFAVYGVYEILKAYNNSTGIEKNRIRYVLIGTIIGWIGGGSNYLLWYDIPIFPVLNITISIYMIMIAYAIVRHQLMDIEVIIKRTLVFASLFTIVFGIFVGITVLLQQFIGRSNNILGFAISSLVIIFTVRPLEIFLIKITDRYLFQKKYDYKHLIRDFMDELKTMVLNTTDIAQSTVDFLNTSIRPITSAVFMYNKFTSQYDLVASSDFKDKDLKIAGSSELVKVLGDTGKILLLKDDNKLISFQERDRFAVLSIELIIPLLIHKELIGFLCLAKKKSDEDYSNDDTEALSDLSGALSISLNNAQLFDERADAEKRALVGTIATGINHEIGNPLNIITIKLDTFRILAKEGLLVHKTKEEIIDEVDKITKVCLDSAQRIAEITKQVSEFAKPDKKLVFGKVNISEAIDETIAFLKHGMILDVGKIEKSITCEPAYVLADRGQLKQILFNLIKNASHAIDKEKGKIIVNVDKNNSSEIAIKIIDNGHGMPKEVKDKVFTPFFTTKEPGKGTGLGLAMVKIMIDRNDARIKVESEEGKGTTFTLIFKGGLL